MNNFSARIYVEIMNKNNVNFLSAVVAKWWSHVGDASPSSNPITLTVS
jgi:hypothetical protein